MRVWLPLAIRAPTPIRALVHSSTLVTAGVFIVIKIHHLLAREVLLVLGVTTMLVAGVISLLEIDLKKIVALSTLRQLGLIVSILGGGLFSLVFFHILSHAFVKSALFIVVGNYLVCNLRTQDKRSFYIRGEWGSYQYSALLVCVLALIGISFTRGLVTKEAILLSTSSITLSFLSTLCLLLGVRLTFVYSYRVIMVCKRGGPSLLPKGGSVKGLRRRFILLLFSVCSA